MRRSVSKAWGMGLGTLTVALLAWQGASVEQQSYGDDAQDKEAAVRGVEKTSADAAQAVAPREGGGEMAFPTGDRATSALLVETMGPTQVPIGRPYTYQIKVTNLTKNQTLDDVAIRQTVAEGTAIESAEPKAAPKSEDGTVAWSIPRLAPGESKTIKVSALGEKEGASSNCIRVSYQPSLCMTTRFIKQEVQLAKEAPKQVDLCDDFEIRYAVKNVGSGVARGLTVRDALPEGLTLADGKTLVTAPVGDLAPGQTKDYRVKVSPTRSGDYTSRAVVEGQDDLRAQSNQTTTAVRQSKLAIKFVGPEAQYANQAMSYQVTVANEGQVAARDVTLAVQADPNFRVARMSKASPEGAAPQVAGNALSWKLGAIEPGKSTVVSLTGATRGQAELKHTATATAACARDAASASASAAVATDILTLPALLLELVDRNDPIQVGETELYTIVVINQGDGEDRDVKVVVKLPDGLTYVSSEGPTQGTAAGQVVTFAPIDRLAPKAKVTYTVQAKATKAGDVRTQVELSSDYLRTPVPELEPTRLID